MRNRWVKFHVKLPPIQKPGIGLGFWNMAFYFVLNNRHVSKRAMLGNGWYYYRSHKTIIPIRYKAGYDAMHR